MGAPSEAPGLRWRKTAKGRVAYWVCRADIARRGFPLKAYRLWSGSGEPADQDFDRIAKQCAELQHEMLDWFYRPAVRKRLRKPSAGGSVYFARCGEFVKIGFAVNVKRRISHLQAGSPVELEVLGSIPGTPVDEARLHRRFKGNVTLAIPTTICCASGLGGDSCCP